MFNGVFGGGGKGPGDQALQSIMNQQAGAPNGGDDKDKGNNSSNKGGNVGLFDPSGLERAAKAARELDQSKHAREAMEIVKTQEKTKQHDLLVKAKEYEAHVKQLEIEVKKREGEENRKTIGAQQEMNQRKAEYEDQIKRKRIVEQMNADKYRKEEELKRQEEAVAKQEAIRRKTIEYEAELRQKTEKARVELETRGKIQAERENHDLRMKEAVIKAEEYRKTVIEGLKVASKEFGRGFQEYIDDPKKLSATALTLSGIFLGLYTARVSTGIAGKYIEARLGKPSLVRDTSRRTFRQRLTSPIETISSIIKPTSPNDVMKGIVLKESLTERLNRITVSTANTKKNGAPFRNLCLHGPPGTGKTLFAKGLATHSGLDYAILTGGDVAPLGKDAVTEIHKVFDWAETSRKGVLIFVDEADAFLRRRSTEYISEDMRNALNAFLYRTGTASEKFMVVFASNQPEQFDWAINDRIDEMVDFALPGEQERLQMLTMYIEKFIREPENTKAKRIIVDENINSELLEKTAKMTKGFSGREISKLVIGFQAAAYGASADKAMLTKELYDKVVDEMIIGKQNKITWLAESEIKDMVQDAKK